MPIIVRPGQSILDLAIQSAGSIDGAMEMARINGISLTGGVAAGDTLDNPQLVSRETQEYYAAGPIYPATSLGNGPEGIGYWIIGLDFKVS